MYTRSKPFSSEAAQVERTSPRIRSSLAVEGPVYPTRHEPQLIKTPWELERHKKSWRRSKVVEPRVGIEIFNNLPKKVHGCIVAQLEQIFLDQDHACASCYLKDLHSMSLVSRAWNRAVTHPMYHKVLLLVSEEHTNLPRLKIRGTSRIKLLRRTLRGQPALGRCVRELHMFGFQTLYRNATIEKEELVNIVASLVRACPYLERLVGFHIPYTHSFDRLSHALSTRANLKDRMWLLSEQNTDSSDEEDTELGPYYLAACDPIERFLELNSNFPLLSTLVLHENCYEYSTTLNFRAIVGTLQQLPALRNLSISGLSAHSFTNLALNALPPQLQSLRLENLPGVNDKGLQRFATSHLMTSIEALMLINLEVSSLITISNILSPQSLSLKSFTFAQLRAPGLSSGAPIPKLVATRLQQIHWEIRSEASPSPVQPSSSSDVSVEQSFPLTNVEPFSCLATSLLAVGIRDGAFPSLRRFRIPHDPQGFIQALCKPLATALLPCDIATLNSTARRSTAYDCPVYLDSQASAPEKARDSAIGLPLEPLAESTIDSTALSGGSSPAVLTPAHSRFAAQSRISVARKTAFMIIRVYNPDGDLKMDKLVGGFIGEVGSRIVYDLSVDRGRMLGDINDGDVERNEWITNTEDLLGKVDREGTQCAGRLWRRCGHWVEGQLNTKAVTMDELFR